MKHYLKIVVYVNVILVRGPAHPQGHSIGLCTRMLSIELIFIISGFHWDRDEVLADKEPGNIKHPIVATVT